MHSFGGQLHVVAICLTLAAELNLISTESGNFEKAEAFDSSDRRCVGDSYFREVARDQLSRCVIYLNRRVLTVVIDLLYRVLSWHEGRVLQVENLARCLADKQVLEVKALRVKSKEGVLAECAHF